MTNVPMPPHMLVYLCRYALSRTLHTQREVADLLVANSSTPDLDSRRQIVQDIDVALAEQRADAGTWIAVREVMK